MLKIFIGFIFVFFHFKINNFDLLVDFAGYILIYFGLKEFPDIAAFRKAKPWAIALLAESLIDSIFEVLGFYADEELSLLLSAINIAVTVISIYLMYLIVMGIKEIEQNTGLNLDSAKLYSLWKGQTVLLLVASALTAVAGFAAVLSAEENSAALPVVSAIPAVAAIVINILILVHLYRVKKALDTHNHKESCNPEEYVAEQEYVHEEHDSTDDTQLN